MQLKFSKIDEKRGYPFFALSSFSVWIAYRDGNKRTRYSIETNTTISQLLSGRVSELQLNKTKGLQNLVDLVNRQASHIKAARIYYKGLKYDENKLICEFKDNNWLTFTKANLSQDLIGRVPFQVQDQQIIINLNFS
jgi:hypothetical protein